MELVNSLLLLTRKIFTKLYLDRIKIKHYIFSHGYVKNYYLQLERIVYISLGARQNAFDEFNSICMEEKISKERAKFHSYGMLRRKREKHINALKINTCKINLQLAFDYFLKNK